MSLRYEGKGGGGGKVGSEIGNNAYSEGEERIGRTMGWSTL